MTRSWLRLCGARRQKAEGRRQRSEGRGRPGLQECKGLLGRTSRAHYCLLPSAFCLLAVLGAAPARAQSVNFLSAFGGAGTGNGQFNHPSAIAVGSDGTILIADTD